MFTAVTDGNIQTLVADRSKWTFSGKNESPA
jgi:hypothetical protein